MFGLFRLLYAKHDRILRALSDLQRMVTKMAGELDTLTAAVARNTTVIGSALVLIQGLKAALDAAGTDPAKLAALSAQLAEQDDALAAAVTANTPAT